MRTSWGQAAVGFSILVSMWFFVQLFAHKSGANSLLQLQGWTLPVAAQNTEFAPTKSLSSLPQSFVYEANKKYIFLTWDDSPQMPGTEICNRIFLENEVKATFFSVGQHYEIAPSRSSLIDSMQKQYPKTLILNHGYSHAFGDKYETFYTSLDSAVRDFQQAEQVMKTPFKMLRLPGRNAWYCRGKYFGPKSSQELGKKLGSLGYQILGWDVEWQFSKGSIPKQSAQEMLVEIRKKFAEKTTYAPNMLVLLAHDRMFAEPSHSASLRELLRLLKAEGYLFETLDHYPAVQIGQDWVLK